VCAAASSKRQECLIRLNKIARFYRHIHRASAGYGNPVLYLAYPVGKLRGKASILFKRKGGITMAYFVILSNLTDEGRKTIKNKPERIIEVNKELEVMGVKVLKQYALLGIYDFLNIVEAPDNETVMKMSVELGSRGSVQMTTLPAIAIDEFIKKIK
jgi:uncharacterized protein with GYD domain